MHECKVAQKGHENLFLTLNLRCLHHGSRSTSTSHWCQNFCFPKHRNIFTSPTHKNNKEHDTMFKVKQVMNSFCFSNTTHFTFWSRSADKTRHHANWCRFQCDLTSQVCGTLLLSVRSNFPSKTIFSTDVTSVWLFDFSRDVASIQLLKNTVNDEPIWSFTQGQWTFSQKIWLNGGICEMYTWNTTTNFNCSNFFNIGCKWIFFRQDTIDSSEIFRFMKEYWYSKLFPPDNIWCQNLWIIRHIFFPK